MSVSPLNSLWAGNIYGTNTGRVFLQMVIDGDRLTGTLRIADNNWGLSTLDITGKVDGDRIFFEGFAVEVPEGVQLGKITATAIKKPNGNLSGEWHSEIGTAGTFELFPHIGAQITEDSAGPEQLYTASRDLGVLRLSREDVLELIKTVQKKFPQSKVVVTHLERGAELARYSPDFEASLDRISELRWIKINAQAVAAPNLQKILTIDLGANYNRVTTQSPDESWALGEAEATASFLRAREKRISTAIGKYKVNANQLIALCALGALPDLLPLPRFVFIFSVVGLIIAAYRIQIAVIPNLIVSTDSRSDAFFRQAWPTFISWLVSVTAAVAASVIYGFLVHH